MSTLPLSSSIGVIPGVSIPIIDIFNIDNKVYKDLTSIASLALQNRQRTSVPIEIKSNTPDVTPSQSRSKPKYTTDFFKIVFRDSLGEDKSFVFSLLPAIESHTQLNNPGNKVPGVLPGISITTRMRQRGIVVPGSAPVYQSIGIESMTIPLYGAFIGGEKVDVSSDYTGASRPSRDLKIRTGNELSTGYIDDAYGVAEYFNNNIVLPSKQIRVEIHTVNNPAKFIRNSAYLDQVEVGSSTYLIYTGLITQFKPMVVRGDRCYYCIELAVTKFPEDFQKPKLSEGVSTSPELDYSIPVPISSTDGKAKNFKIIKFVNLEAKVLVRTTLNGQNLLIPNFGVIPGTLYSIIIYEESPFTLRIVLTTSLKSKTPSDMQGATDLVKNKRYTLDSEVILP